MISTEPKGYMTVDGELDNEMDSLLGVYLSVIEGNNYVEPFSKQYLR